VTRCLCILESQTPKPRKEGRSHCGGQLSAYQRSGKCHCEGPAVSTVEIRDSRIENPVGHMHFGIENPETPTRDKTEVTGKMVIWARSLARRANA
jgi:hypothetical protein